VGCAALQHVGDDVAHALRGAIVVHAELVLQLAVLGRERLWIDVLAPFVRERLLEKEELVELVRDVEVWLLVVRPEGGFELLRLESTPVNSCEPTVRLDILKTLPIGLAPKAARRIAFKKL
jgi:hypothetical protein